MVAPDGISVAQWIAAGRQLAPDLKVTAIYGDGYAHDERPARELGALLGIVPVAISSPDEEIGHNTLFPMLVAGSLSDFLVKTLEL